MLLMAVARFRGAASVAEKFQKISNFFLYFSILEWFSQNCPTDFA